MDLDEKGLDGVSREEKQEKKVQSQTGWRMNCLLSSMKERKITKVCFFLSPVKEEKKMKKRTRLSVQLASQLQAIERREEDRL